jgi:hypothetical protein
MLEKKLQEELNRYRAINKYGKTMIMEQEAPPADPALDPALDAPADPAAAPMDMAADPSALPTADGGAPMDAAPAPEMDSTEEVDITDLVNMVKSVKKDQEDSTGSNNEVITKMDDVFTKLTDLEQKLAQMDQVMSKIDQLGATVEANKPKTEVEKLEMRSLDSYPFNEKPQEFFAHKQGEMRASGKNEYVLTKDEVENYPIENIKTSFNPNEEEDEFKF